MSWYQGCTTAVTQERSAVKAAESLLEAETPLCESNCSLLGSVSGDAEQGASCQVAVWEQHWHWPYPAQKPCL